MAVIFAFLSLLFTDFLGVDSLVQGYFKECAMLIYHRFFIFAPQSMV